MREILFRGKRCDNSEWVQGYYIRADHHWHNHGIHKDWITLGASANGGWFALHNKYAVKAETIGQFTGLTDKNGKKIFEGDIIEWFAQGESERPDFGYIEYDEQSFAWRVCWQKYDPDFMEGMQQEYISVIGNIHDNPDLLNGGAEDEKPL